MQLMTNWYAGSGKEGSTGACADHPTRRTRHGVVLHCWNDFGDGHQTDVAHVPLDDLLPNDEDSKPAPEQIMASLKKKTSLDARLYEFVRLADEQYGSVVWEADGDGDTCAAADVAAEAAASRREAPTVIGLDEPVTFSWDGDSYRVYEVTFPPPPRAVQLLLRGKNAIGSSRFTVNIFISHRLGSLIRRAYVSVRI